MRPIRIGVSDVGYIMGMRSHMRRHHNRPANASGGTFFLQGARWNVNLGFSWDPHQTICLRSVRLLPHRFTPRKGVTFWVTVPMTMLGFRPRAFRRCCRAGFV